MPGGSSLLPCLISSMWTDQAISCLKSHWEKYSFPGKIVRSKLNRDVTQQLFAFDLTLSATNLH